MTGSTERDARLREAFASLTDVPGEGRRCPPAERIIDSADGRLDPDRNREVIRHIGECAACSTAWWLARETTERTGAMRVEEPSTGVRRVRSHWPALAAAAVLVLAAGLVGYRMLFPSAPDEPVFRIQGDTWLSSALPNDQPVSREGCVLRWTAGPEGTTYDIMVTDEDLELLSTASGLPEPEHRIDPDFLSGLPPGAKILWQVTAHTPDGTRIRSATFTTAVE